MPVPRPWRKSKKTAKAARIESVMQAPMVRAVLDRFPGAEIVAVRDVGARRHRGANFDKDVKK